jgi:DNA-binding LacI/PurR family transcriptional regulator/biotin operon repressor
MARVEQLLRQAIAEGRFADGRLPTEVDLATQLGVSRETVRLAADNLEREGLLVKIRRKGTFLQAPRLPDQIEARPSTCLGYLQAGYPDSQGHEEMSRQVSALVLQGALEEASRAGYRLAVRHAPYTSVGQALQQLQQEQRLAGIIFAHYGEEKLLRRTEGLGLPTVLLDHDLELTRIASVRDDSFAGACLAVRHLAELGHRRIAFVNWRQEELNPWRARGYRQGLRDAGVQRRRAWELRAELTAAGAARAVSQLLALTPRPTALYCFNNLLASLIIAELQRHDVAVPADISVLGGGGEEVSGLTCHQADWYQMGRLGAAVLLHTLHGAQRPDPPCHLCPHTLRLGQTTAAPG